MKYRISPLPNTQHANCFIIRDAKGAHETRFKISKKAIDVWGKPEVSKLKSFMIAYVKKNGWVKEPVDVSAEKSPRNLDRYIDSLHGKSTKTKKKA